MRRSSLVFIRPAALAALMLAGCSAEKERTIPVAGAFTRAGFHLTLLCAHETPQIHDADLLYPIDSAAHTFTIVEDGGALAMRWDDTILAQGSRNGNTIDFVFDRHDPFTPPMRNHGVSTGGCAMTSHSTSGR